LNYYLGTPFIEITKSDDFELFYTTNNWDSFNDELVRFEGNIFAYIEYE